MPHGIHGCCNKQRMAGYQPDAYNITDGIEPDYKHDDTFHPYVFSKRWRQHRHCVSQSSFHLSRR